MAMQSDMGAGAMGGSDAPPDDNEPLHGPDDEGGMPDGGGESSGKPCGYLLPDYPGEVGDVIQVKITGKGPDGEKEISPVDGGDGGDGGGGGGGKQAGWRDAFDQEVTQNGGAPAVDKQAMT